MPRSSSSAKASSRSSHAPRRRGGKRGGSRKGRRSRRVRLGRTGRRLLVLLVIAVGPVGFFWYQAQDEPTQEAAEVQLLEVMDFLREWDRTPIEVVRVLDVVADWIPVSKGVVVDLSAFDGKTEFAFGGLPEGPPELRVLRNQAYLVGYDEARRNPAWATYRLFKVSQTSAPERPEGFVADRRTRRPVQSDDYTGSGYDRGHLAPNFGMGLCYGVEAQEETFFMTNIVPQNPELNRGLWNQLEQRVARRISQRFDEIWVICGPIYEQDRRGSLKGGVRVPDAFFKIVLDETAEGVRALAFRFPQEPVAGWDEHDYLVSVDAIEAETGLDFFSTLPPDVEAALESAANVRVW